MVGKPERQPTTNRQRFRPNPQIRLITIPRRATSQPQDDVDAKWQDCGPQTVGDFSAVAYFFGRDLQQQLKVPVGLISTNYGGTPAEAWTSHPALEAEPSLKNYGSAPGDRRPEQSCRTLQCHDSPAAAVRDQRRDLVPRESNAGRAYEYRTLFPTMIKDWRAKWGQGDFPVPARPVGSVF